MIHRPGDPLSPKARCDCEGYYRGFITTLPLWRGPYRVRRRPIGFIHFDPPTTEEDWGERNRDYRRQWADPEDVI